MNLATIMHSMTIMPSQQSALMPKQRKEVETFNVFTAHLPEIVLQAKHQCQSLAVSLLTYQLLPFNK